MNIAIIGGGPSGLTLACILQKHGITSTVFEMDASPSARFQGGSFDLHPASGQQAIKNAGLWTEFLKLARFNGDCMKLCNPGGFALINENENPRETQDKPEIDRKDLRDLLQKHLHPGCLKWGKKVSKVTFDKSKDAYNIHFEDGSIASHFTLIVGADGAWSKVRPLLTNMTPVYSGVSGVGFFITDAPTRTPNIADAVGSGSWFTIGDNSCIISQINGDQSIKSYFYQRVPENYLDTCGIDWSQSHQAKQQYMENGFHHYHPTMKRLATEADDTLDVRKLYMLPVGLTWPSRNGITVIGDAAHLMTPFAGVGLNVAMQDAADLADAIVGVIKQFNGHLLTSDVLRRDLYRGVARYESEMFARSRKYAQLTYENMQRYLSVGGAEKVAAAMNRRDDTEKRGGTIDDLLGYA